MKVKIDAEDALLVVDLQNDFLPGGALGVPSGDAVIPTFKTYIEKFRESNANVIFSRDWHPEKHCSFKEFGGPWPPHCVKHTEGANFESSISEVIDENDIIINKGMEYEPDVYSAFGGFYAGKSLNQILDAKKVKSVFVGGLATDYCVLATIKDALRHEFKTFFLYDASAAVKVNGKKDELDAINTMACYGAVVVTLFNFE